jgi:hypothetical protein
MAFGDSTPGTLNVRIRTPEGVKAFDVTDFGPYPLFSTVRLATTQSAEIRYFQYGRGSPKPGAGGATATKLDTNMEASNGQLDAAAEMLVYSMRIILPPAIKLADVKDLFAKTYSALFIASQKPSTEGRMENYPAAGGIAGHTTKTDAEQWTNGSPQANAGRVFATPHYLPGITAFSVSQEFPNGALALSETQDLTILIDGLRRRNVT